MSANQPHSPSENGPAGPHLGLSSKARRTKEQPISFLIMEALLPPDAMRNHTSRQVRDRLAGLHGMARGIGHKAGIPEISDVSVGAVRAHFIGDRGLYRDAAKRAVLEKCRLLGWPAEDHNAADALACWSYVAAIIDPKHAIEVSPLFRRTRATA